MMNIERIEVDQRLTLKDFAEANNLTLCIEHQNDPIVDLPKYFVWLKDIVDAYAIGETEQQAVTNLCARIAGKILEDGRDKTYKPLRVTRFLLPEYE